MKNTRLSRTWKCAFRNLLLTSMKIMRSFMAQTQRLTPLLRIASLPRIPRIIDLPVPSVEVKYIPLIKYTNLSIGGLASIYHVPGPRGTARQPHYLTKISGTLTYISGNQPHVHWFWNRGASLYGPAQPRVRIITNVLVYTGDYIFM